MIDTDQYDKEIAFNSVEVQALAELNQNIRTKRKFVFERVELAAIEAILLTHGIVRIEGDKIHLISSGLVSYMALLDFQDQFNFKPDGSLTELFQFLKQIDEYFDQKHFQGKLAFLKEINAIALYLNYAKTLDSFDEFSITWKTIPDNALYTYATAFGSILPFLTDEPGTIYRIVCKLLTDMEFDKPGICNIAVYELYGALSRYAAAQPKTAKEVLKLAEEDQNEAGKAIATPIITGLLSNNRSYLDELSAASKNSFYQLPIADALTRTVFSDQASIDKALAMFQEMEKNGAPLNQFRPGFHISILNNPNCSNNDVLEYCLDQLKTDLLNPNEQIWHPALRSLNVINKREEEINKLLIAFVEQEHFAKESIPTIAHVFFDFEDCTYYFDFLKAYGTKWRYSLHEGIFQHVNLVRDKSKADFDRQLINLMTDDKGYIRLIGEKLFSTLSFSQGVQEFAIDLCALDPMLQLKVITAVLEDFHEPKYTVPFLLPLLKSTNTLVVEILVSRLEVLTDEYGSAVTEALKKKIDLGQTENRLIFERVEKRMLEFSSYLGKKNAIKELNPWYSDSKEFNYFIKTYQQEFAKGVSKHVDENSIFRHFATTVILAKGGGWKHPTNNEVSQLGKFGTSFSLPRSYFVSPDNFEFERRMDIVQDWSELFEGWEATLLS